MDFNPGHPACLSARPVGCAVDIGTTSLAYYFIDLESGILLRTYSEANPQSVHGADVISRINYCIENSGGEKKLQSLLMDSIDRNIKRFISETWYDGQDITSITAVGNTTMLHLAAGADPRSIAFAPFNPVFTDHRVLTADKMGLHINAEASMHLLPSVSGYIGADIVAGIASLDKSTGDLYLYVDIGTNGELALVSGEKVWACATAAGPAFEGTNISCGSAAVEGAISSYINGEISTIAHQEPEGICGSGLIDITAYMLMKRLITSDGKIKQPYIVYGDDIKNIISINQKDIREIQLAKAAIAAGINIILRRSGYNYSDVDKLVIAGGFGNYLDPANAVKIGLLPYQLENKVLQVGNAAGTGAVLALKSQEFIDRMKEIVSRTEYIELSADNEFIDEYVKNMDFRN